MGLGFFIAKTLLERSGAMLELANRPLPEGGAVVTVRWPRSKFEHAFQKTPQSASRSLEANCINQRHFASIAAIGAGNLAEAARSA